MPLIELVTFLVLVASVVAVCLGFGWFVLQTYAMLWLLRAVIRGFVRKATCPCGTALARGKVVRVDDSFREEYVCPTCAETFTCTWDSSAEVIVDEAGTALWSQSGGWTDHTTF